MSEDSTQIVESNALESIERAQIDMQIATAKRYPRVLSKVKQDMLSFATLDEDTAASCFYTLPRGGKAIQGPSIRLAEIAISCYSNLRVGSRVLTTVANGDMPHVIIQAVAHDLEKNVAITIEKRRRITKKKSKEFIDEDDINLACNACTAIALRDAVFKVVPLALVKPVYEAAKKVAVGEASSLVTKRGKIIDRLKQMGVTEDRILAVLEVRKMEDIGLEQLEILIGLGTALKDGDTTVEEAFPPIGANAVPKAEATPGPKTVDALRKARTPTESPDTAAAKEAQAKQNDKPANVVPLTDAAAKDTESLKSANPPTAAVTPSAGAAAQQGSSTAPAGEKTAAPSTPAQTAPTPPTTQTPEVPPSKLAPAWLPFIDATAPAEVAKSLNEWMATEGVTDAEVSAWAMGRNLLREGQGVKDLTAAKSIGILKNREKIRVEILSRRAP